MRYLAISAIVISLVVVGFAGPQKKTKAKPKPKVVAVKFAEVEKVFVASCNRCHGEGRARGGIDLRTAESVRKGGDDGPILVAGDPANSVVVKAMRGAQGVRRMPPRGESVAEPQIKLVEAWIKAGAKS